jgi:serine/threonine-protein kinase
VDLVHSPGTPLELGRGSYLLKIAAPDCAPVTVHHFLERGADDELQLTLPRLTAVPPGFLVIPSRSDTGEALFAMQATPVTCGEYLSFLNALATEDPALAASRAPRVGTVPYWKAREDGRYELPKADDEGDRWDPQWPVFMVNHDDAQAYAAWRSSLDGRTYRLPTAKEWLVAAQGGDQRPYPWGTQFDPSLCHMRDSRLGKPLPVPVGTYATDVSPYGVRDVAGNIAEWTSTRAGKDTFVVQGAAFNSLPVMCRLDYSMSAAGGRPLVHLGFRLLVECLST